VMLPGRHVLKRLSTVPSRGMVRSTAALEVEQMGHVLTVRFDREARLNALSEAMARDILDLCEELQHSCPSDIRCVVVTGKGRAFSTGRDLKESASHSAEDAKRYMRLAIDSANAFSTLPMPSIAAINGACFGWGVEAALSCDIRLSANEAKICFPETRLGIFPGAGGTPRAAKLLGLPVAKELIFSARVLGGAEAAALGLANQACPAPELDAAAAQLAQQIAANGPLGVRAAKRVLEAAADLPLHEGLLQSEAERFPLNDTLDFAEGIVAHSEKRTPNFLGT